MFSSLLRAPASPPAALPLPFPESLIRAGVSGFPSPAEDYAGRKLDLNARFVKRPGATFYVDSRIVSVPEFDHLAPCLLLCDQSVRPRAGHVVVAQIDGLTLVSRWLRHGGRDWLSVPAGDKAIPLDRGETTIVGVVRSVHISLVEPAVSDTGDALDLNARFIPCPSASFFMRAAGDSMLEYKIPDPCLLLIDRSIPAAAGRIVVALVDGEVVVKKWERRGRRDYLVSGADRYPPVAMSAVDGSIWGVVRSAHMELGL